ncbi:MAG: SMP-30/gluconolactonase/LRE family protein [Desulfobacterales bacterium]|nr:SMP-30/gluconolactonase/LRE family protein [Desulfobacterales bacterium]
MLRKGLFALLIILLLIVLYFLAWPVPIEPVAWKAPPNPGYTGPFARNDLLKAIEFLKIGTNHGPEDVAVDDQGRIYLSTHEGFIVRLQPDGAKAENLVNTNGRPLGIDFDNAGNLIVADAFRGLLSISPEGKIIELATDADGIPIRYADDVDCAADGKIYFSDASMKFGAKESGGTMEGSLLDINEHGGHGRLLVYDPATRQTKTLLSGLNFANGVAVSHDQTYVLISETGSYRIIRYWIAGPNIGKSGPIIENLPGFPDNISTGFEGRFWVALISPRNKLVDNLSEKPFLRKVIQRMPKFIRPKATAYGHIIAIDGNGRVLKDLQDPKTGYPQNTSVTETKEFLYIGSLVSPVMAYLVKSKVGL